MEIIVGLVILALLESNLAVLLLGAAVVYIFPFPASGFVIVSFPIKVL